MSIVKEKPSILASWVAAAFVVSACACPAPMMPIAAAQDMNGANGAATTGAATPTAVDVQALVARLPVSDAATATQISRQLLSSGRDGILRVAGMIVPFEQGGDAKARFAMNGMALQAGRPEAGEARQLFTKTLATLLTGNAASGVKEFYLQQLNVAGGPEAIAGIGSVLLDKDLYDDACQALEAMRGQSASASAAAQLRAALPKAQGRNLSAIVKALGELRDRDAASLLTPLASDANIDIRLPALFALANIGQASSVDAILKALTASTKAAPYERGQTTEAALVLATRLTQAGGAQVKEAERILGQLQKTRGGAEDRQVQTAVLSGLSKLPGGSADAGLLQAMTTDDRQLSAAAINTVATIPGADVTTRWVARLKTAAPLARAAILSMLGQRADAASLPAILAATKDADASARAAAITAAGAFEGERAATTLVALLAGKDRAVAQRALQRVPGASATDVMAKALATTSGASRRALIETLEARGATAHVAKIIPLVSDSDAGVRTAAWSALGTLGDVGIRPRLIQLLPKAKTDDEREAAALALVAVSRGITDEKARIGPVVAAQEGADVPTRNTVLRVLGRMGGTMALAPVQAALKNTNPEVLDTAVRVLADWPDAGAIPTLLEVAKTSPKQTHKVLALRGYVRLVGINNASSDENLQMYKSGMALAARPEERKLVLGGMGGVPTVNAMQTVAAYLKDNVVAEEAAAAVVGIAQKAGDDQSRNDPAGDKTRDALRQVMAVSKSETVRRQAQDLLERPNYMARPWQVIGPFPNAGGNGGFDTAFDPEQDVLKGVVELDKSYTAPGRVGAVKWKSARSQVSGLLDFLPLMDSRENVLAYATIAVKSPDARSAIVSTGSDDGARVWVNGQQVISKNIPRGAKPGEDQVPVQLKAGWNQVLLKITQGGGGWEFYFDLLDAKTKKPLLDLTFASRPLN